MATYLGSILGGIVCLKQTVISMKNALSSNYN